MKVIKSLTTTLSAKFESLVNEVEDQKALIDAMIKDIKQARASVTVQLRQVERDYLKCKKEREETNKNILTWQKRTVEVKDSNPEMAKDCVRKIIYLKKDIEHLESREKESKNSLDLLQKEKDLISKKLAEFQNKRHAYLARETRVKAQGHIGQLQQSEGIFDVFERWDDKITRSESINEDRSQWSQELDQRDELEKYFEENEINELIDQELANISRFDLKQD